MYKKNVSDKNTELLKAFRNINDAKSVSELADATPYLKLSNDNPDPIILTTPENSNANGLLLYEATTTKLACLIEAETLSAINRFNDLAQGYVKATMNLLSGPAPLSAQSLRILSEPLLQKAIVFFDNLSQLPDLNNKKASHRGAIYRYDNKSKEIEMLSDFGLGLRDFPSLYDMPKKYQGDKKHVIQIFEGSKIVSDNNLEKTYQNADAIPAILRTQGNQGIYQNNYKKDIDKFLDLAETLEDESLKNPASFLYRTFAFIRIDNSQGLLLTLLGPQLIGIDQNKLFSHCAKSLQKYSDILRLAIIQKKKTTSQQKQHEHAMETLQKSVHHFGNSFKGLFFKLASFPNALENLIERQLPPIIKNLFEENTSTPENLEEKIYQLLDIEKIPEFKEIGSTLTKNQAFAKMLTERLIESKSANDIIMVKPYTIDELEKLIESCLNDINDESQSEYDVRLINFQIQNNVPKNTELSYDTALINIALTELSRNAKKYSKKGVVSDAEQINLLRQIEKNNPEKFAKLLIVNKEKSIVFKPGLSPKKLNRLLKEFNHTDQTNIHLIYDMTYSDNPKIKVSLKLKKTPQELKRVVIAFTDNGLGIKPEFLSTILTAKKHRGNEYTTGTGLGLYGIYQDIIKHWRHLSEEELSLAIEKGLLMEVKSDYGQGTVVTIALPLIEKV